MGFGIISTFFWVGVFLVTLLLERDERVQIRKRIDEMDKDPFSSFKSNRYLEKHNTTREREYFKSKVYTMKSYGRTKQRTVEYLERLATIGKPDSEFQSVDDIVAFVDKHWDDIQV